MSAALTIADWIALAIFLVAWLLFEPFLKRSGRSEGLITANMAVIRRAWMRNLVVRENQFMDGQLLGQILSSSSFLASSNLVLIAAAAGRCSTGRKATSPPPPWA
jgi:uncharacterized membrane protein